MLDARRFLPGAASVSRNHGRRRSRAIAVSEPLPDRVDREDDDWRAERHRKPRRARRTSRSHNFQRAGAMCRPTLRWSISSLRVARYVGARTATERGWIARRVRLPRTCVSMRCYRTRANRRPKGRTVAVGRRAQVLSVLIRAWSTRPALVGAGAAAPCVGKTATYSEGQDAIGVVAAIARARLEFGRGDRRARSARE